MLLQLKRGWPAEFRRSVRDAKGNLLKTLVFVAGEPQELADDELAAVTRDVGHALEEVVLDEVGRARPVRDLEADAVAEEGRYEDAVARLRKHRDDFRRLYGDEALAEALAEPTAGEEAPSAGEQGADDSTQDEEVVGERGDLAESAELPRRRRPRG